MDDSIYNSRETILITDEELSMLEERWKEHKKNPSAVKTWEEVKANIFRMLE